MTWRHPDRTFREDSNTTRRDATGERTGRRDGANDTCDDIQIGDAARRDTRFVRSRLHFCGIVSGYRESYGLGAPYTRVFQLGCFFLTLM